ncbi:MAG TPA: hypothetical protein VGN72_08395 [Tepidisphaeraceae bacterium]|jgi:hypothetical protein|nr:hypothetical protein [Tepidisphaeraceae bacterium]
MRSIACILIAALCLMGCAKPPKYGTEVRQSLGPNRKVTWAVAPAINLSGQSSVDPLLQADLLYQQLQQVEGVTVVPVNRVAELYLSLGLEKVQSTEQAALVCDLLGVEALMVPTITIYDPYNPPKLGASLQLFIKPGAYQRDSAVDPYALSRMATPGELESLEKRPDFEQAVGMFDAANGSVRQRLFYYAAGRNDPVGPLGNKEYLASMERYCGFVYHELIGQLIQSPRLTPATADMGK